MGGVQLDVGANDEIVHLRRSTLCPNFLKFKFKDIQFRVFALQNKNDLQANEAKLLKLESEKNELTKLLESSETQNSQYKKTVSDLQAQLK